MDLPLQFTAPAVIRPTDATRPVQSVTLTGHGNISRIKVTPTPLQKDVDDDHVEVEVHYCGLNFTDNYLRLGLIRNSKFPVIMGSECSGIVRRVGNNVTDLEVGQKVLCLQMQGGLFRHLVHVHRKYCFPLPDDISVKDAVSLGLNFVVAHFCLHEFGGLDDSEKVFMQSIAGGVGTALIQLARTVNNVEVLGTASESKHDRLQTLGLKWVFCDKDLYEANILEDYPEGVDIVVNTNGGIDIERCLKILKPSGRLVLLGSKSTVKYTSWAIARPKWDGGEVSSARIVERSHSIVGVNVGVWLDFNSEIVQQSLTEIFKLYSDGKINPSIHAVWPFDQVAEGITQLTKRENFGKVILEVKQEAAGTQSAEASTSVDPQTEVVAVEEPKETEATVEKKAVEISAEKAVEISAEKAVEISAEKAVEISAEKAVEISAEKAVEISAEKAVEKIQTSVDPQPEVEEPKEKVDPDVKKEDPASTMEPKVIEPSHCEEPKEVAEGTTEVGAP